MAARRPEDRGNSSLEFVWVRLNGSDTTIEGALRTVQQMRNGNQPVQRQLPNKPEKGLPGKKNGSNHDDDTLFPEEPVDAEVVEAHTEPAPAQPAPRQPARKSRLPKGIADLDFNSAAPTFRDFVAEKKPKDQFDWYLLVAYWMKKYKQIDEIGLPHVVTAKQYIGPDGDWGSLPEDAGQPFRDGRRASHGIFEKGSRNGLSKITKTGEDRVDRMGK